MPPDVSVVIPTHNRRSFLESAVQSCFAGNESLNVEVVVADDGSTDGTRDWLRQLGDERVRPVFQEHQGAQVARNRGTAEAEGTFVKFLDDDDTLEAGALACEVEALEAAGADVSYGHLRFVEADGTERVFRQGKAPDLMAGILRGAIRTHPGAFLYRRHVLDHVHWAPALSYHQDKVFALRVAAQCFPSVRVDQVVGIRNEHGEASISNTIKASIPSVKLLQRRVESTWQALGWLREKDNLRDHHVQAAASGLWTWAHMLSAYDLEAFDACWEKIRFLDPTFEPPRTSAFLKIIDRMATPVTTERLMYPTRAFKRNFLRA